MQSIELLHSSNEPGITCDHRLEVVRAGAMCSGTSRMGCMVEPAHMHTERPYNPCGYRVFSSVANIQQWRENNGASAGGCGVDITFYLAGHYC